MKILWAAICLTISSAPSAMAQESVRLLIVAERKQQELLGTLSSALEGSRWTAISIAIDREEAERDAIQEVCRSFSDGVALVFDLTWGGWSWLQTLSEEVGVPYLRGELSVRPFVQALEEVLSHRNVSDAALIFNSALELDQALYYLVGHSMLRVVVLEGLQGPAADRLARTRPIPTLFVIFGKAREATRLLQQARMNNLVQKYSRWGIVVTDFAGSSLDRTPLDATSSPVSVLMPTSQLCCSLLAEDPRCDCPPDTNLNSLVAPALGQSLLRLVSAAESGGIQLVEFKAPDNCVSVKENSDISFSAGNASESAPKHRMLELIPEILTEQPSLFWDSRESRLLPRLHINVEFSNGSGEGLLSGTWTAEVGYQTLPDQQIPSIKRFFRVGTVENVPWAYKERDLKTGKVLFDEDGNPRLAGYCIDFIRRLAELMNFDYEIVLPRDGRYGYRNNKTGLWTGAVGDLVTGETDILVAALTMTSEREEVVDFVPPYFEQSGISIVIRKPVRRTSLFKFMTVLRLEVWLSIVAALVVTGFMIWLLDKYSPYSARNNKAMYPYPCREFTLKESFWFALTSFTPQGGGEAPKALSGRTLVAAYWLFVVLMLATFTANLAAFLTVERMQTPVQSLEQLARQSRINYTVVNNSDTHSYFKNMKHAEDTLYRVWKEITLNASSDQSQYRVWDYPIKEQYGHILLAIEKAGTVPNSSVGFRKVVESEDAEFAFIHNAAQVKYEVSRNCNLTEVGEVFAEQPYAVAVQQGSYLQEEISRKILELQKDRYFESLFAKYWNYSMLGQCSSSGDNEGITLESLGGVFIATLFGLVFAMITLAGEVFYHRHRQSKQSKGDPPPAAAAAQIGDKKTGTKGDLGGVRALANLGGLTLSKQGDSVLLGTGQLDRRGPNANARRPRPVNPHPRVSAALTPTDDMLANPTVSYISVYPRDFY